MYDPDKTGLQNIKAIFTPRPEDETAIERETMEEPKNINLYGLPIKITALVLWYFLAPIIGESVYSTPAYEIIYCAVVLMIANTWHQPAHWFRYVSSSLFLVLMTTALTYYLRSALYELELSLALTSILNDIILISFWFALQCAMFYFHLRKIDAWAGIRPQPQHRPVVIIWAALLVIMLALGYLDGSYSDNFFYSSSARGLLELFSHGPYGMAHTFFYRVVVNFQMLGLSIIIWNGQKRTEDEG